MIRARYFPIISLAHVFYWTLSIVIGSVLSIAYLVHFSRIASFAGATYLIACIGALFAYGALTWLIIPTWRKCSSFIRYFIICAAILFATFVVAFTPLGSLGSLVWQAAVGPHSGQPAQLFGARSWASGEQQAFELHASENPNDPVPNTTYGIWRVTARLSDLGGEQQLRFFVTQPDWAVIDQQTGQPYPDSDGVTIVFKAEHANTWQTVQQIFLNPAAQPDDRHWRAVDVLIPTDSEQLAIEVRPGGNNAHDRVWITTGIPRTLPKLIVQPAIWVSTAFLTLAALLAVAWGIQTRPGSYVQSSVQSIIQPYGGLLTGLSCLLLGYMLVWRRGMYLDDYSIRFAAFDKAGQWKSFLDQSSNVLYPARLLTWEVTPRIAALLLEHELVVRSLIATFVGLNALLLGWLIYRMIGSRLAAFASGWLFLMPVLTSATVWAGASTYVFSATMALTFLHLIWSSLIHPRHAWWWIIGSVMALTVMLLFGEAHLSVILIAGLLGIIWVTNDLADAKNRLGRVIFALLWPLLTFGCLYLVVFRNPHVVETRGGIATNPQVIIERGIGFLYEFYYWSFAPGWGQQTTEGFFSIGLATIGASFEGCVLAGIAVALAALTTLAWRSEPREYETSYRVAALLIGLGVIWFVIALTIPLALAEYSIYYESRFAYFPLAGVAVIVGMILWVATKLLRHQAWEKLAVGVAGVILLFATVSTVGLTQAYAARHSLDREQIEAIQRNIPQQYLPNSPVFVAIDVDEQLPGDAAALPVFGTGVLEAPWAGCPELRAAYQRDDVVVFSTNRWVPLKFSYTRSSANMSNAENLVGCPRQPRQTNVTFPVPSSAMVLLINDTYVPLDKVVLFTYHDGKATPIESLNIKGADGTAQVVQLPVGATLQKNGIATISELRVENQ